MSRFQCYIQLDARDCGPTCLRMIAKFFGKSISLKTLRERCYINRSGVSMRGISEAAESIGMRTIGARLSFHQLLTDATLPCIAHWNQNHFVVIYKIKKAFRIPFSSKHVGHLIYVADPALGLIRYTSDEFKNGWISTKSRNIDQGHCLLIEPAKSFYIEDDEPADVGSSGTYMLFSYLAPHKGLLLQLIAGFLASSIISLLFPLLTQSIVDKGINFKDTSFLTLILIAQLALTIGSTSIGFIRGWIMLHLTNKINVSLISDFLVRLMRLPLTFFESKMTGDIMQRIGDNGRIQNFLTNTALNLIFSAANFLIFSIIIATYNIQVFFIFLAGSALYIAWITFFLKYRRELDNRRFAQMSSNQNSIIQLVNGMQEIKMNNCEQQKRWEWERIQAKIFKISSKGLIVGQYQSAGGLLINSSKNFIITYLVAKSVIDGRMTLGMMLSVQYIIGQLNSPIESMIGFIQSWQDAKISMERLGEIEDKEFENNNSNLLLTEIPEDTDIHIENLSFSYGGPNSLPVLSGLNFVIPRNKVTAIVGASGSGKTTLLKLLLGFYKPVTGTIKVGSASLLSINIKVWRQNVGTVLQDGFIFSDSIANNISVSDEIVDKRKLLDSVIAANIRDFIESLPLGYNTKIGSSGVGISQGQKQRILIARAVYKNPRFLFLDEATNSLDANNEHLILDNLTSFFAERTVVTVAHRLSTVKNADNIIVMDKGKIVEQGNHADLINGRGYYHNLIKNQLDLE